MQLPTCTKVPLKVYLYQEEIYTFIFKSLCLWSLLLTVQLHDLADIYIYIHTHTPLLASLVIQMVKNLPAMQETWVQSLGQEDPLVKGVATHSNILAWRIPQIEPGRLLFMGSQRVRHNWATKSFTFQSEKYIFWNYNF